MRETCCDCYFKRKVADMPENAWCTGQIENVHTPAIFSDCKASLSLTVEDSTAKDFGSMGIRSSPDFMNVCVCTFCFEEINSICMPHCSSVQANPINYTSYGYEIFKLSPDLEKSQIKYYTQYGPGSPNNNNINNQHFCPLCIEDTSCSQKVSENSSSLFDAITNKSEEPISLSKHHQDISDEAHQTWSVNLNDFNSATSGLKNENLPSSIFENDVKEERIASEESLPLDRFSLVFEKELYKNVSHEGSEKFLKEIGSPKGQFFEK